jgi:hypothetical protein
VQSALTWGGDIAAERRPGVPRQPIGGQAGVGQPQSAVRDPTPAVSPAMIDSPEAFWFIPGSCCRAGREAFEGAPWRLPTANLVCAGRPALLSARDSLTRRLISSKPNSFGRAY